MTDLRTAFPKGNGRRSVGVVPAPLVPLACA
jgi:hypothetical protein